MHHKKYPVMVGGEAMSDVVTLCGFCHESVGQKDVFEERTKKYKVRQHNELFEIEGRVEK